jgi:hypothetical protein
MKATRGFRPDRKKKALLYRVPAMPFSGSAAQNVALLNC